MTPSCSLFPGPGAYMPKFPLDKKGNMVTTKDGRFKSKPNEVPGPGAYEVRFRLWTSLLTSGPCLDIKTVFPWYRDIHDEEKYFRLIFYGIDKFQLYLLL